MANAKRASMREGPLAALFRKTEEAEELQAEAAGRARAPPEPARAGGPAHRRRTPARPACRTPR